MLRIFLKKFYEILYRSFESLQQFGLIVPYLKKRIHYLKKKVKEISDVFQKLPATFSQRLTENLKRLWRFCSWLKRFFSFIFCRTTAAGTTTQTKFQSQQQRRRRRRRRRRRQQKQHRKDAHVNRSRSRDKRAGRCSW